MTILSSLCFGQVEQTLARINLYLHIKEKIKMKKLIVICLLFIGIVTVNAQQGDFPKLTGPYLGQKPPGMTPEVFAPGIVSRQLSVHSATIFSPDGKEMYWTVMNDPEPLRIVFMKQVDGVWMKHQEVPFSGSGDDANPFFSSSGNALYFKSTRENGNAIWYSKRYGNGWSNPVNLSTPFSSRGLAWQASITKRGTLYFVQASGGSGTHDIYRAECINGKYLSAEKLGPPINSDIDDWQVFCDPEEKYLIFGRYQQPDPSHQNGLYISFHQEDGSWSKPKNIGPKINTAAKEVCPFVTLDGQYLFL